MNSIDESILAIAPSGRFRAFYSRKMILARLVDRITLFVGTRSREVLSYSDVLWLYTRKLRK